MESKKLIIEIYGKDKPEVIAREVALELEKGKLSGQYPTFYFEGDCGTTSKYWECECDENFIQTKPNQYCDECGAHVEEQPDARIVDVIKAGLLL